MDKDACVPANKVPSLAVSDEGISIGASPGGTSHASLSLVLFHAQGLVIGKMNAMARQTHCFCMVLPDIVFITRV